MGRRKKEILEEPGVSGESSTQKRDNLFSESIPRDIVNEALQSLHFNSIEDTRVFTLKDLQPTLFNSALLLVESYYIPCKAKKYLYGEMTTYRVLTVVRQLLRSQGYGLFSQEKTVHGKKELHYQIRPTVFNEVDTAAAVVVSFD
jgi:hypothetical protein